MRNVYYAQCVLCAMCVLHNVHVHNVRTTCVGEYRRRASCMILCGRASCVLVHVFLRGLSCVRLVSYGSNISACFTLRLSSVNGPNLSNLTAYR